MTNPKRQHFGHRIGDEPGLADKLMSMFAVEAKPTLPRVPSRLFKPKKAVRPDKPIKSAAPARRHRPLAGDGLAASKLDFERETSTIKSFLDRADLEEMVKRHVPKPERLVVAALIVEIEHPGSLARSAVRGWPLVAWHPSVACHLNADSPYLRARLEQLARRLRNRWLDSRPSIRGNVDESLHPDRPVGYSTTAWFTGGE